MTVEVLIRHLNDNLLMNCGQQYAAISIELGAALACNASFVVINNIK